LALGEHDGVELGVGRQVGAGFADGFEGAAHEGGRLHQPFPNMRWSSWRSRRMLGPSVSAGRGWL
jgi:hypothetical protein